MLSLKLFPQNKCIQCLELPRAEEVHQSVIEQVVERAHFPQPVEKAPTLDMLSFGHVHLLWKWEKVKMKEHREEDMRTGGYPSGLVGS